MTLVFDMDFYPMLWNDNFTRNQHRGRNLKANPQIKYLLVLNEPI